MIELAKAVCLVVGVVLGVYTTCVADSSGMGTDMWTRTFDQWGLYTPHEDYCDSTEVFIAVSGTGTRGFCIEKDERNAAEFEVARDDCASDKKRLPEPGEWKFACMNYVGLNNMTDDSEWMGNHSWIQLGTTTAIGVAAIVGGNGGCKYGAFDWLLKSNGAPGSYSYRCVR